MTRDEMDAVEILGASTDIRGTYLRGIRVGRSQVLAEVIEWMAMKGYPVGERSDLTLLLFEIESMALESGRTSGIS